jgi:hypothetical protein
VLASVCGLTLTEFDNYNPSIACTDLQLGQVFSCTPPNVTVVSGSTCTAIASTCDISLTLLQTYNPSLVCTDLQLGEVVNCNAATTGVTSTTVSFSTVTVSTTTVSSIITTITSTSTSSSASPTSTPAYVPCIGLGTTYEYRYCLTPGTAFTPDDAVTEECCVNPGNVYLANGYCMTPATNATNYNYTIHDCCYSNNRSVGGNWTSVGTYQAWSPEQIDCLVGAYPDSTLSNKSSALTGSNSSLVGYGVGISDNLTSIITGIIGQNTTTNITSNTNITSIFLNSSITSSIVSSTSTTSLSLAPSYTTTTSLPDSSSVGVLNNGTSNDTSSSD